MGFFSPPSSSSSRHRNHGGGSSSHRHRSGGGHPSSSSSRHSGGNNGSSSNPRKKAATGGDGSAADGVSGPDPTGMYTGYDPTTGAYYYDYADGTDASGYYAAEGSNANHGYYDHYAGGHPSATTTPEEDAAAAAAAAATAGEDYYTSSVTSAVAEHVYEAGLQFHGFQRSPPTSPANSNVVGPSGASSQRGSKLYALPNDETEKNRDDMKHGIALLLMQNRLFYAPVDAKLKSGGMVYDLGTGTGIWAMDVAEQFPSTVVRGIDLSPMQPAYIPPNVSFTIDDFEDEWVLPPNTFDLVHMRFSLWAVDDRAALLRRAFHHLKPGGFVEFQDLVPLMCCDDGTLPPAHVAPNALRDFARYVGMGLRTSQRLAGGDLFDAITADPSDPHLMDMILSQELAAAGFTGIRTVRHKCPLGGWPEQKEMRRCGLLLRQAMLEGLRGWSHRPLGTTADGLGWTPTQIEIFLVDVRKAIMDTSVHAYFPMHITYAQKPMV
ncbi:tam domain protein [Sporothrix schenckii 1099-18]|uniref:Methyltransferase domain-containing protein n=2 Tax=Sporothrix schenckii TaxID=29908 RepID=U7PN94_SPOS1|nr:tam domain protein [Sporothrix schenckii 1099-18]ERS97113.1 hypothetical protein HMPREF1624_06443 [Sporothrix schenckii ATCC 58251]KJR86322.1 tam domain protein [Sporothrix schenckii 1099-18]